MLPDNDVRGDTVLTVVEENNTKGIIILACHPCKGSYWLPNSKVGNKYLHALGVHGLASVELKVLDVGQKLLLDVALGTLLEGSDLLSGSTLLLEGSLDRLHVACSRMHR